jgi:tetratricopeptide (TPR) repeat protein
MLFNEDDVVGAESEARRAIELNPSLPEAYDALSNVVLLKGKGDEGLRLSETVYSLDPIRPSYISFLGFHYFCMGKENEALAHWKKTAELAPADTYSHMAEYYLSKGDHEKAKEFFSMVERLEPNNPWVTWMKGFIAARTGDQDTAILAIEKIHESRIGPLSLNYIGYIKYALGDLDSYFENLNRAIESHAFNYMVPMYDPLFAEGRADTRYLALLEKMKKMYWHSPA